MPRRRACDSCHAKKIQCDASEPKCEWCLYRGISCTYERPIYKKTKVTEETSSVKYTSVGYLEQRLARIEDLVGTDIQKEHGFCQKVEDFVHRFSSKTTGERIFYGDLYFAGFALGETKPLVGIPVFSNAGLDWIRERTGSSTVFEDVHHELTALNQHPRSSILQSDTRLALPSRLVVHACFEVFSRSPLRQIFPIVNIQSFGSVIEQAYDAQNGNDYQTSLAARTNLFAFMAALSRIEPDRVPFGFREADAYASEAQRSLIHILAEPGIEGLQGALMLCIYHDFSGNIYFASVVHSVAVRCIYLHRGHLQSSDIAPDSARRHLRDLFWLCYFFDKHLSLRTGHPASINDADCDLTLEEYEGLAAGDNVTQQLYPSDIRLTIIKSRVSAMLYSRMAFKKSDSELLRIVRELDEQLEQWRLSVPMTVRPHLSVKSIGAAPGTLAHKFSMFVIFVNLEYLYLISAIHQACARCITWSDKTLGTRAISSSLILSVQASRSTLLYLQAVSKHVHRESFWLIIFYPLWATMTLFCNILHDPTAGSALQDINILQSLPCLIVDMRTRALTPDESQHLQMLDAFIAELVHLAHCAITKHLGDS